MHDDFYSRFAICARAEGLLKVFFREKHNIGIFNMYLNNLVCAKFCYLNVHESLSLDFIKNKTLFYLAAQ